MSNSSDLFDFDQFADDSTVTHSAPDIKAALQTVERELENVLNWLAANKLIINIKKTHLMLFTNRKRPQTISIKLKGETISEINETKFLGVMIDSKLNWQAHLDHISNKISKTVSMIRFLKYTFPKVMLKTLYLTLIYPYIAYCNVIWGSAAKCTLNPLVLLQKKVVRIICKTDFLAKTDPLFKHLKILKIYQVYNLNCALLIYKCYNSKTYKDLKSHLRPHKSFHNYMTRNKEQLRPPFERLQLCLNSFFHNGIKIWNSIPNNVKNAKTLKSFKVLMKSYLIFK